MYYVSVTFFTRIYICDSIDPLLASEMSRYKIQGQEQFRTFLTVIAIVVAEPLDLRKQIRLINKF